METTAKSETTAAVPPPPPPPPTVLVRRAEAAPVARVSTRSVNYCKCERVCVQATERSLLSDHDEAVFAAFESVRERVWGRGPMRTIVPYRFSCLTGRPSLCYPLVSGACSVQLRSCLRGLCVQRK